MNQASLFLSNLTCVDHAYINTQGMLVGGSFNPSFMVTGEIDHEENVVIDFSTVKKRIKAIIDDKEVGLDHKLHIYSDSNCSVEGNVVVTPYLRIEGDQYYIRRLSGDCKNMTPASKEMVNIIKRGLSPMKVNIECLNSRTAHYYKSIHANEFVTRPLFFRYAHGLRQSSSWACQNIAHGHLSFLQGVAKKNGDESKVHTLIESIAHKLNNSIFVWKSNIVRTNDDSSILIEYESLNRGKWSMYIAGDIPQPVVVLDNETTIEHLVADLVDNCRDQLREAGVSAILMSEGLTKGAWLKV